MVAGYHVCRKAGIGKTCLTLNWSTVDVFIRLSEMHILRATGLEEDPGVFHRESHLLALGVARTQSSEACWQQPRPYDLAGMVRGTPHVQRTTEPGRRTDERNRRKCGGNGNRKKFGEIIGQEWKTSFLFPSSPMWKQHSVRRKTGVDRTQRHRQRSYPPPDLKELKIQISRIKQIRLG